MKAQAVSTVEIEPKTLALAVSVIGREELTFEDFCDEFVSLLDTLGFQYQEIIKMRLRSSDRSKLLTKGKLEELMAYCSENSIKRILVSWATTPLQKRNLEDLTGTRVLDRHDIILNIFKQHAVSKEGQVQVKMAEIELLKTRLSGMGSEMDQQQAGVGSRGPGESIKEFRARFYQRIYAQGKKELEALERARDTQRRQRLESSMPLVSIVGYTNAGKSSLLNLLSGSAVLAEDKLFATLDTTVRRVYLNKKTMILLADTIGFISNLPHGLIKAFKTTLDELVYSHCLVEVVDLSSHGWAAQIEVVKKTLEEIGVNKPIIYCFNKIDKIPKARLSELKKQIELSGMQNVTFVSVFDQTGIEKLKQMISKVIEK